MCLEISPPTRPTSTCRILHRTRRRSRRSAGLTHITTLSLQDCGLNNTALTTSVNLPALQSLDLRYNDIGAIPSSIASLSNLTSLLVYGNSALANDPRTGLLNLKGKLINVDLAPDNPEKATTIADLAAFRCTTYRSKCTSTSSTRSSSSPTLGQ